MHRAELTSGQETVKRKNPDGSRIDVTCPPLLPDYQQYMRGVDRGDQLIGWVGGAPNGGRGAFLILLNAPF